MKSRLREFVTVLLLASVAAGLAACALGEGKAVQWVTEDEAEKARLNAAGFPQYVGAS
jgi:hypothetical protein